MDISWLQECKFRNHSSYPLKKLTFLFCFLSALHSLRADHLAGAEIRYTYIGDSTGIARHYLVELLVYRDMAGIGLPPNQMVWISSSCFPNRTLNLSRSVPPGEIPLSDGGYQTSRFNECVEEQQAGMTISTHYYSEVVILSHDCHDIRFYWWKNARNASDNLVNAASANLFVQARLNSLHGPNSSPRFNTPAAKAFCTHSNFYWAQGADEQDSDSVFYRLVPALSGPQNPPLPIPYETGYSSQQPLSTQSGSGGVRLDSILGVLEFITSHVQEVCVIALEAVEFRRDTAGVLYQAGSTMRDMQVVVASQCAPSVTQGPRVKTLLGGSSTDTLSLAFTQAMQWPWLPNDTFSMGGQTHFSLPKVPYDCYADKIVLDFEEGVLCHSIAADASDFRLFGPDSLPISIVGCQYVCDQSQTTFQIELLLAHELQYNGTYWLQVVTGTDSTTLENVCGYPLNAYFTMAVSVRNCFYPVSAVQWVSTLNNQYCQLHYRLDTTTFPLAALEDLFIERSLDSGQTFQTVGHFPGQLLTGSSGFWIDSLLPPGWVAHQTIFYRTNVALQQRMWPQGGSTPSLVIDTLTTHQIGRVMIAWPPYPAWNNVRYRVERSSHPQNTWLWREMNPGTSLTDNFFSLPPTDEKGCFTYRVWAFSLADTSQKVCSNWLTFCQEDARLTQKPEEEDLAFIGLWIPNVFTPNGDGHNDLWIIGGWTEKMRGSIGVYNRWGELVFQSEAAENEAWDGRDFRSGTSLPDGVYFYALEISDDLTEGTKTITGTVTLSIGAVR